MKKNNSLVVPFFPQQQFSIIGKSNVHTNYTQKAMFNIFMPKTHNVVESILTFELLTSEKAKWSQVLTYVELC